MKNLTTFEIQKTAIEALSFTDFTVYERYAIIVLINSLGKDLETDTTDLQLSKKVGCSDRAIRNMFHDGLIGKIFETERVKHKTTFYKLKPFSLLLLISETLKDSKDKNIIEIIKSFKEGTLTINGNALNYYQNDLFFEEVELVNEKEETAPAKQEEVKQEVKKLTKEEKKVLTEKLKKFYDANPSFKQENTTYFISSVKICETLILSGFTFEQIQEETLRNGKSFAYSKAVLTSNNNKVETKKQNEVVKINNNIFEDIF
jgi:hypothetical protein